jgi:hypothetical protein
MYLVSPFPLVGKRQLAEHGLGIGYHGLDWLRDRTLEGLRARPAAKPGLRVSVAEGLPGVGRRGRRIVDVAGIAVIGRIVLVAPDGAIRDGIIVEVGQLGSTLIFGLILDTAALADDLPASYACCSHCCVEAGPAGR